MQRLYFLDWLRISALLLLILFHVGMLYVVWPFHVKSAHTLNVGQAFVPWMKLTEPWRMSLLFTVSGAAAALMLSTQSPLAIIRQRAKQLLPPLLVGVVLIVPPQSYFEVQEKYGYAGTYVEFLKLYFSGYGGFCQGKNCLILPTWNHLWFLPYLWIYVAILCLLLLAIPERMKQFAQLDKSISSGFWLLLIPVLWVLLIRIGLNAQYPQTYAIIGDWYAHALYGGFFLFGWFIAQQKDVWHQLSRWRWLCLCLAGSAWAVLAFLRPAPLAQHAALAIFIPCAIIAAFGFAYTLLNFDHPWRKVLSEAVFPVYLLHQTVLITLAHVLKPLNGSFGLEFFAIVCGTFAISFALYFGLRRIRWLRPWMGMRSH